MHRNTARRYLMEGKLPSERKTPRTWRTRQDPFAADWPEVAERLEAAPELEAKALFEDLLGRHPGRYQEGQLRTFQRHVKQWRAEYGPPKEIFLPQEHRPGEAMQTDFTSGNRLRVTIGGERFEHLLCHSVLPYSNWQSVSVCLSESMLALRGGVQKAVFSLGRVSVWHQTDHSTAATHDVGSGQARGFNAEYQELMDHLGLKPRTIGIGACHQNGDVEAANGALKRRIEQYLLLRGSRDFPDVAAYESFLDALIERANATRQQRLNEELAVMRPLAARRLPRHRQLRVRVTSNGTIRVLRNTYSVPPRLAGEQVVVHVDELNVEVFYGGRSQLRVARLRGEAKHCIDYRHVIDSLVKKPWGFARYRYREALFPSTLWRRAYAALSAALPQTRADLEYLRVLQLAAKTMQCEVEAVIERLLGQDGLPQIDTVRSQVVRDKPEVPEMAKLSVELTGYDELLVGEVAR
jgi:hypothetical protein